MAFRIRACSLVVGFTWTLIVLTGLAAGISVVGSEVTTGRRELSPGAVVLPPIGRTLEGGRINSSSLQTATCVVVRFESRWCEFSRADSGLFDKLERAALSKGCESVIMAPDADSYLCQLAPSQKHTPHRHLSHPTFASTNSLGFVGHADDVDSRRVL